MSVFTAEVAVELVFDDRRLLTPGVHDVTIDLVKEAFGKFQKSDRRPKLFEKLCEYLESVKRSGIVESVLIDGSFVMACIDEPEDIDVVLVLPADWDITVELKPHQYNILSKKSVRRTFRFDQYTVTADSPDELKWIEYFGRVNIKWREKFGWPPEIRKGILRVLP